MEILQKVRAFGFDLGLATIGFFHKAQIIQFVPDASETLSGFHYNPEIVEHAGNMMLIFFGLFTAVYRALTLVNRNRKKPANEIV